MLGIVVGSLADQFCACVLFGVCLRCLLGLHYLDLYWLLGNSFAI